MCQFYLLVSSPWIKQPIWTWTCVTDRKSSQLSVQYRRHRCIGYLSAGRGFKKSKRSRAERHVWLLCYLMIAGMCFMHRVCEADYISSRVTAKVTVCTEADYHFLLTTLNRHHRPLRWKVHSVQCTRKKKKETPGLQLCVLFHRSRNKLTFSWESDLLTARSTVEPQKYDWNSVWPG